MKEEIKVFVASNKFIYLLLFPILKLRKAYLSFIERRFIMRFDKTISNIMEGSVVVNLKNIPGKYEIDARSHLLHRILISKVYEPAIVELIIKYTPPNKDAINIGANVGLFTNLIAIQISDNCRVLAIEPTPHAYGFLKRNIARNGNESKIILYNGIAIDKPGDYKMNVIQGKEEYSSIGKIVIPFREPQIYSTIDIKGDTIDNLVVKYNLIPGIIVIDVEGAEYAVLKGSVNTIKKYKPVIISEIVDLYLFEQESSSKLIIKLLDELGYRILNVENSEFNFPFTGNLIAIPNIE